MLHLGTEIGQEMTMWLFIFCLDTYILGNWIMEIFIVALILETASNSVIKPVKDNNIGDLT